jgi:hypothetical protein
MASSYESFKNLAAGVQSWVLTIAVLVGGGWTLWTFRTLQVEERAKKELFAQAQINVDVTAKEELVPSGSSVITATVKVTNTGGRNVLLDYGSKPLSIRRISFTQQGQSLFDEPVSQDVLWGSRVLRAGETDQYPLVLMVRSPGMYLVEFKVPLPRRELQEHLAAGGPQPPSGDNIYWQGSAVVNVRGRGGR